DGGGDDRQVAVGGLLCGSLGHDAQITVEGDVERRHGERHAAPVRLAGETERLASLLEEQGGRAAGRRTGLTAPGRYGDELGKLDRHRWDHFAQRMNCVGSERNCVAAPYRVADPEHPDLVRPRV